MIGMIVVIGMIGILVLICMFVMNVMVGLFNLIINHCNEKLRSHF